MTRIVIRPAAVADIEDAFDWYESRRAGLGWEFFSSVRRTLSQLATAPETGPVVHRDVRRLLTPRFPYALFYKLQKNDAIVLACFHARRKPLVWRSRK